MNTVCTFCSRIDVDCDVCIHLKSEDEIHKEILRRKRENKKNSEAIVTEVEHTHTHVAPSMPYFDYPKTFPNEWIIRGE
jgi:hypothetical protein